jgi:ribosomal protein S18 acetylase RimI-like enzyme
MKRKIDALIRNRFSYLTGRLTGMLVTNQYTTQIADSGLTSDMFNNICCTGDESEEDIERSIQHFRRKQLPFCWWVGFDDDPHYLVECLNRLGLTHGEEEMVMTADLQQVHWQESPSNFEVKIVKNQKDLDDFLEVMVIIMPEEEREAIVTYFQFAQSLLFPPHSTIHFLVGYIEGKPVATSSVFYSEGFAGIFDVIVDARMRGKGLGKAITLAVMRKAFDDGYTTSMLTATNDAKFLYDKIGFKSLKLMGVYT